MAETKTVSEGEKLHCIIAWWDPHDSSAEADAIILCKSKPSQEDIDRVMKVTGKPVTICTVTPEELDISSAFTVAGSDFRAYRRKRKES